MFLKIHLLRPPTGTVRKASGIYKRLVATILTFIMNSGRPGKTVDGEMDKVAKAVPISIIYSKNKRICGILKGSQIFPVCFIEENV